MAKISQEEQQALNKEYANELRKLKRRVRNIEKRGYSVSKSLIPKKPKTIRQESIENLKKRKSEFIYKRSVYTSPQGTTIKGTERRSQERSEAAKKAAETRWQRFYEEQEREQDHSNYKYDPNPSYDKLVMFQNVYEQFALWTPNSWWSDELKELKQRDRDIGWGILQGAINELGSDAVADNMYNNALRVNELVNKILYESGNQYKEDSRSGEINHSLVEFEAIIRGRAITIRESIEWTNMGEALERHELV